jgi:hypothetical protein
VDDLRPDDWSLDTVKAEEALLRPTPWLGIVAIVAIVVLLAIAIVVFRGFVAPVVNFFTDWIKYQP